MTAKTTDPRVFISYSWTNPKHERWVIDFAERLCNDGVDAVLDKWDLKEGQDKFHFMEQMVRDPAISRVLMICDRLYAEKADGRSGGVGTESQIISKEIYENVTQEKFVPLVTEHNDDGKPCLPTFASSRIYIDFTDDSKFEENYEKLLRNIYEKPMHKKPSRGVMPSYLQTEAEVTSYRCVSIQKQMRSALINDRQSALGLFDDFVDAVVSELNDGRIQQSQDPIDEKVISSINRFTPIRDAIVDSVIDLCKYRASFPVDKLKSLLEKTLQFNFRPHHITSWNELDFDAYRFFNYELMLYVIAVLIKKERYQEAGEIIFSHYFYHDGNQHQDDDITSFNNYIRSLDDFRNKRLNSNRTSITADQIKERAKNPSVEFNDLLRADCLLYFVMSLKGRLFEWYPRTLVYHEYHSNFDFFVRLKSLRHFEKVKPVLGVGTVEEFKNTLRQAKQRHSEERYSSSWGERSFPSIGSLADPEKVCTVN